MPPGYAVQAATARASLKGGGAASAAERDWQYRGLQEQLRSVAFSRAGIQHA